MALEASPKSFVFPSLPLLLLPVFEMHERRALISYLLVFIEHSLRRRFAIIVRLFYGPRPLRNGAAEAPDPEEVSSRHQNTMPRHFLARHAHTLREVLTLAFSVHVCSSTILCLLSAFAWSHALANAGRVSVAARLFRTQQHFALLKAACAALCSVRTTERRLLDLFMLALECSAPLPPCIYLMCARLIKLCAMVSWLWACGGGQRRGGCIVTDSAHCLFAAGQIGRSTLALQVCVRYCHALHPATRALIAMPCAGCLSLSCACVCVQGVGGCWCLARADPSSPLNP